MDIQTQIDILLQQLRPAIDEQERKAKELARYIYILERRVELGEHTDADVELMNEAKEIITDEYPGWFPEWE